MAYSFARFARIAATVAVVSAGPALAATVHSVGSVTWHPKGYVGKTVQLRAYVLAVEGSVVLLSDEASGPVSAHDLPVTGTGTDQLAIGKRYVVTGVFTKDPAPASNGSPYHLQLTAAPTLIVK